jgi:hypothetical protein
MEDRRWKIEDGRWEMERKIAMRAMDDDVKGGEGEGKGRDQGRGGTRPYLDEGAQEGGGELVVEELWRRQPGESEYGFQMFQEYLGLGAEGTYEMLAEKKGKTLEAVSKLGYRHHWLERAAAWREHLESLERGSIERVTQAHAMLQARRAARFKELEWNTTEKLVMVVEQALDAFLEGEQKAPTLMEAARALEVASKIGRLSMGLATERMEHTAEAASRGRTEFEKTVKKLYGMKRVGEGGKSKV